MISCPACGKENEDSAFECKRCRAPLREEIPEEQAGAGEAASSDSLGEVCRRCEAYNEPGTRTCTACGFKLFADAQDATPPGGSSSLSEELSALALSDQEAAEAGLSTAGNGAEESPQDRTPAEPFKPPTPQPYKPAPSERSKGVEMAAAGLGAVAGARRAPEPPPPAPAARPAPPTAPAEKPCANCGAANPPTAKFCFDCGTPFVKKPAPPPLPKAEPIKPRPFKSEPPPSIHVDSSIEIDPQLIEEATSEAAPVSADQPLEQDAAEELSAADSLPEEPPAEEPIAELSEPMEEPPPFPASLVVEKGGAPGTAFILAHLENSVGASGAHVVLGEDPFVAPHAATLVFAGDHLVLRDEGSANGVFVKVRESAPLESGDLFVAGERLLRYEGPCELDRNGEGGTPFLGAPRPQGSPVRVTEVLASGKTGRTCHRGGPIISIGRTGCDMNFPSDALLAARHAEIRLDDGGATLVDLSQGPSGLFVRVRPQGQHDLQAGDLLQIGDQLLRVDLG